MFNMMEDGWTARAGSAIASLMFLWAVVSQYFDHLHLNDYFSKYTSKLVGLIYPYIQVRFPEQTGQKLKRSEAYSHIESYLANKSTTTAKKLKAEMGVDSKKLDLSMDDYEEIVDYFDGVKLWWASHSVSSKVPSFSFYPRSEDKRHYQLTFHRRHRDLVNNVYLDHVMKTGKAAAVKKRERRLYTNSPSTGYYEYKKLSWIHVPFVHPATFDTIAMDPIKKEEIVTDLTNFTKSKNYYEKIGKAWKRGYLLYGPPGTGKSSMVAAMANLLDYDIYDLELTAVKNNTMLRKLLIDTTSKSIIVLEDIDCSLDLTGKRKKKKKKTEDKDEKETPMPPDEEDKEETSKVTLSGLLNFIDGLWSSCGSERIIVFTTNHIEKLDPALIRRGRMDKHIKLSYCRYEAFKVLANNYLDITWHPLFQKIEKLIGEVDITPADVAENLIPKSLVGKEEDVTLCLESLIQVLEECKLTLDKKESETKEGGVIDSVLDGGDDDDEDDQAIVASR